MRKRTGRVAGNIAVDWLWQNLAIVDQLCVLTWRNDVVAWLKLKEKTCNLANLLPNDNVARVIRMRGAIEGLNLLPAGDLRKIASVNPTYRHIPSLEKGLRIFAVVGANDKELTHWLMLAGVAL